MNPSNLRPTPSDDIKKDGDAVKMTDRQQCNEKHEAVLTNQNPAETATTMNDMSHFLFLPRWHKVHLFEKHRSHTHCDVLKTLFPMRPHESTWVHMSPHWSTCFKRGLRNLDNLQSLHRVQRRRKLQRDMWVNTGESKVKGKNWRIIEGCRAEWGSKMRRIQKWARRTRTRGRSPQGSAINLISSV